MSSRAEASAAAARISSCTCTLRAFIFGRSRRRVPTPSLTSSRTNSDMALLLRGSEALCRPSDTMSRVTPGTWSRPGESAPVWPGRTWPLGADWGEEATNFAVRAPEATRMWVCLYDDAGAETSYELTEVSLGIWHGEIPGVAVGTRYGYRADGPWQPELGLRFNRDKLLLDPYAKAVSGDLLDDPAIFGFDPASPDSPPRRNGRDSAPYVPKGVVVHDSD